ncbi:histidine kinase [Streptomyces sp. NPDC047017]|uniref:sensor histidine kinase n=1 Tax=Streptomyces sp. NPDC047017 TaxID=3155024 RepID=UPI0033F799FD
MNPVTAAAQVLVEGLRAVPRGLGEASRALCRAELWRPRRVVGEAVLVLVVGLLAAGDTTLSAHDGTVAVVACGIGAAVLVPIRRVLPGVVLLTAAAGSFVLDGLDVLVPLAAWSVGLRVGRLARAVGLCVLAGVILFGGGVADQLPRFSGFYAAFIALGLFIGVAVPALAGRHWSQRQTLADALREYHAQLVREKRMIANETRLRERQRIAQDMHDSLGHQLTLISVRAGALEVDGDLAGRHREAVGILRGASVAAMHELREVVGLLRDGTEPGPEAVGTGAPGGGPRPQEVAALPGVAGIQSLTDASRAAGATVRVRRTGRTRPLSAAAEHAVYRVVQEGLTNAHKHAPGAAITVELRYEPDSLVVEVANGPVPVRARPEDRGGWEVVSGGQGLTGLTQRVCLAGGMVHAAPTAEGGFRVAGVLPYATRPGTAREEVHEATFVVGHDDFREQPGAGLADDSGAVHDETPLPKDVVRAMSQEKRRSRVWGCGVAAVIVLLLGAAAAVGGYFLLKEGDKAMIEPKEYNRIKVGMSEAEVRDRLPKGDSFLTDGLDKGAPPEPAGAACLSLNSTEQGSSFTKSPVFRFCFKDGVLIEKKSFEVKG